MKVLSKFFAILIIAVFLHACSENAPAKLDPIEQAVANPERPDADKERDANRKPAEILEFFGAEPGMDVIDIFSGGGYYTQILDTLVGSEGSVIAHNNQGYKDFAKDEIEARYSSGNLRNTTQYWAEANDLDFMPESADLLVIVLGIHDVYYKPEDQSWPTIDANKFYDSIVSAIKMGGTIGIIDHRAMAGSPETTGHLIHRIDPAIIIRELTSRGMVLDAESNILANEDDPLTVPMWAAEVKGNTDRFVLRFRKAQLN